MNFSSNTSQYLFTEIEKDYRTVVCPTVDYIDHVDFHYRGVDPYIRGTFNWRFDYKERPITQEMKKSRKDPTEGVKYVLILFDFISTSVSFAIFPLAKIALLSEEKHLL